MAQLEQRLRESELQVHGALLGRGASYGDMCMLRLQVGEDVSDFLQAALTIHTIHIQPRSTGNPLLKPFAPHGGFAGGSEGERVPAGAVR